MGFSSEDSTGIVEPLRIRAMSLMGSSSEDSAGIVEPHNFRVVRAHGPLQGEKCYAHGLIQ